MHRIDATTATVDHRFTEGNPQSGVPATVVKADWLNAIQEELAHLVESVDLPLEKSNNTQVAQAILALVGGVVPPGTVTMMAGTFVPTGYLVCAGAVVSRTTYSNLFAVIGETYGNGDGATTFRLPDLRGEFIRGADFSRGVDPGREIGTAQADALAHHSHSLDPHLVTEGVAGEGLGGTTPGSSGALIETGFTGGSETRPRNVALMYLIKT